MAGVRTYPLAERPSLVKVEDFCSVPEPLEGFEGFVDSLPDIYAGKWFKELVERVVAAKLGGRPVAMALGAHVLKVGLAPLLIDLMRRGVVDFFSMNGAGAIHDFEIATAGVTSEAVDTQLPAGDFGFADETGRGWPRPPRAAPIPPRARSRASATALGRMLLERNAPHAEISLSAECARLGVEVTVHGCLGADIVHMHPAADGRRSARPR